MTRMTRPLVLASLVMASLALAQAPTPTTDPGTSTPEVTPPPPPPPSVGPNVTPPVEQPGPSLADRTETPQRFSRFSAGRGGPLFGFSEFLAGMIGGAFLGGSLTASTQSGPGISQGVYVGAVVGALALGGLGIGIQYLHPIGLASAGAIALATGVGGLAGAGIALAANGSVTLLAALLLAGTQVGALAALLATWNVDDINGEDLALIGMTTLYGFIIAGLVTLIASQNQPPGWPMLIAPAVGMGLGSLWALGVDMAPGRVLKLTALPCGVGLILFYLGTLLASPPLMGITTLVGVLATFGLTYIFTIDDDVKYQKKKDGGAKVMPTVAIMPAGRRNEAIAAGPAMIFTF